MNRLVACAALVLLTPIALAKGSSNSEIVAFAYSICDEIRTEGIITRREIEGKISADANRVAKLVGLSVGADGKLKDERTEYKGLPFDKIADQVQGARTCRLEVAKMLIDERNRLSTSGSAPPGPAKIDCKSWSGPGIPVECLGNRFLPGVGVAPEGYTWCVLDARFLADPKVQGYCFSRETSGTCYCAKVPPGYPQRSMQSFGHVYEGK